MKPTYLLVLSLALAGASVASAQATTPDSSQTSAQSTDQQSLELRACGPRSAEVNYHEKANTKEHPEPQPSPGKAMVYVLRPTKIGLVVQTKVAVDGDWKGVNRGETYFYFEIDPGEHAVCSVAENRSVLLLTVEAGKTYYLQQHIETGFLKARNEITVMPADEAQKKLAKLHLASFRRK